MSLKSAQRDDAKLKPLFGGTTSGSYSFLNSGGPTAGWELGGLTVTQEGDTRQPQPQPAEP